MSDEHNKFVEGLARLAGIAPVEVPPSPEPGGEFPKMLYHPEGEHHPNSPHEMIVAIVHDEEEEANLLAEGWHSHPSHAEAAKPVDPPSDPPPASPVP